MKSFLLALTISMLLCSCAAPENEPVRTVDGSSEDSTVDSLRMMMNNLPALDHCHLQVAIDQIRLGDATLNTDNNLGKKINGMTAEQVIDFSQQYPPLIRAHCAP